MAHTEVPYIVMAYGDWLLINDQRACTWGNRAQDDGPSPKSGIRIPQGYLYLDAKFLPNITCYYREIPFNMID